MSAAFGLYRLQLIDSQMDQARARLDAIRKVLENDLQLRTATEHFQAAESAHKEAKGNQQQAELEVNAQRIKIEQTESSLYGGSVRNPKELQDLQNDVASLRKHLATLEDRLLESMMAMDTATTQMVEARAELDRVESNLGDQTRNLTAERESLSHNLERLEAERKAATVPIDGKLLDNYETLRRDKRGLAVTTVSDGACAACGTNLTPGQQQTARSSREISRCPTCGRILYSD